MKRIVGARSVLLVGGALIAASGVAGVSASEPAPDAAAKGGPSNCLWLGPAVGNRLHSRANFAFPDSGAVYWSSRIQIPSGATLILHARFPHARYESLNSYGTDAAPTDALDDLATKPDQGSRNPFLPGASRIVKQRAYTARVVAEPAPAAAQRRPNTLYAGVEGQDEQRLIYRVYVPDHGTDVSGDVGVPRPTVRLADGTTVRGREACSTLQVNRHRLPLTTLPQPLYEALRDQPGKPRTFPADDPPAFHAYYNTAFSIACGYQGQCSGSPQRTGGQYSNADNNYLAAFVNRGFGHVLVLHGKLPTTPETMAGERRMGRGQLRYWSLCQNESLYTTKGAGCRFDEQLPLNRRREYTIVTSLPADRPTNATKRCGVGFVPWPKRGDGDGHLDDGLLLVRNMLPAHSFHRAVQDTKTPGDEKSVLGPYYPRGTYMGTKRFEQRGC